MLCPQRATSIILLTLCHVIISANNFANPIIWSDFPDNDVFKGPDGAYYFSASSFQFSPGAPILRSNDLINWEWVGQSIPHLEFGPGYSNAGSQSYVGGVWASTMRYRSLNKKWYWIGCVDFKKTYIYTAENVDGQWSLASTIDSCYYDCGLYIDDDDAQTMYVVYGRSDINIAQLSNDGLSQVSTRRVFSLPPELGFSSIEGSRLYKINGFYYLLDDNPGGNTLIWKSSSIHGPYEYEVFLRHVRSPVPSAGLTDQGSLVQGPDEKWFFMSCSWSYPAGRVPVLAPIEFNSTGWPQLVTTSANTWGTTYPMPGNAVPTKPFTGTDKFEGSTLGPAWEWNFNPDETKFSVNNGLTLLTATVVNNRDIYKANNTLTHRVSGSTSTATIHLDISSMAAGDVAGLAAFRDQSAYIAISCTAAGGPYDILMVMEFSDNSNRASWH